MKEDYLKECLSEVSAKAKKAIPMDDFQREFCVYCMNRECARSGASSMLFDRRAANWYKDLFVDVQRAPPGDETAAAIVGKWAPANFKVLLPVQQEAVPVPSAVPIVSAPPAVPMPQEAVPMPQEAVPMPQEAVPMPSEPEHVTPPPARKVLPGAANTPFDNPMFIGPAPSDEQVLDPGGTFTFGGDE